MTYETMLKVLRDMKNKAEGAEKEAISASITLVREKMNEEEHRKKDSCSSWDPGRPLSIDEAYYFYK